MGYKIQNRFEVNENEVTDLYSDMSLVLIPGKKDYLTAKYQAGFIQPLAYDEAQEKIIVQKTNGISLEMTELTEECLRKKMLPLLYALSFIQENNNIYGDLSPNSILDTEEGFFLQDFGSGISHNNKNNYTAYEYYAFQGAGNPTSDVYSVSTIMYELLTGIPVPDAQARYNEDVPIEPLGAFGVSEHTSEVITKGLSLFSDDRYATIQEFMHDLYSDKELANYENDWNIFIRPFRLQEENIEEQLNQPKVLEEEDVPVQEKKTAPKKAFNKLYLIPIAIGFVVIVAIFLFSGESQEVVTNKVIQMTPLPVPGDAVSSTAISGSAIEISGSAVSVSGSSVSTGASLIENTSSPTPYVTTTPEPTSTPVQTVLPTESAAPTQTPEIKETPSPTPKITKKPKATKKPKKTAKPKKTTKSKKPFVVVTQKPTKTKTPKIQFNPDIEFE